MFNKNELPMYYIRDCHEPIIDRDIFEHVQEELKYRAEKYKPKKETPKTYPFTGKIVCKQCGKNYCRKINNIGSKYAKPVWICPTFNYLGKKLCASQQIPEDILYSITSEVLGLSEFDTAVFEHKIKEILVPKANTLIFIFKDGNMVEKVWESKSRSDSWNDELKQQARERKLKYYERRNSPCVQQEQ